MKNQQVETIIRQGTGTAMILAPLMQIIGFALHPQFLTFAKEMDAAIQIQYTRDLYWTMGHILVFLSLPLMLLILARLGQMVYQVRPWHALIGMALGGLGVVMMAGIFGAALAQGAVGTVTVDEGVLRALQAMLDMQGPMSVMFLGALMMVGGMILGAGLFFSKVMFRWSGALFFVGNLILLLWMEIDAVMAIGSLCLLVGLGPIAWRLIVGADSVQASVLPA